MTRILVVCYQAVTVQPESGFKFGPPGRTGSPSQVPSRPAACGEARSLAVARPGPVFTSTESSLVVTVT